MVTTMDVSFGMLWSKLLGAEARWAPGDDDSAPLRTGDGTPTIGAGLVAVWVSTSGPTLVCHPSRGLKAIKSFGPGTSVDDLRNALRAAGAVIAEEPEPRRDTFNP